MTARTVFVVWIAVPFVWLGMVLAISFLATPLKFRAPGITVPLGLGIGRLVFRALNTVELVLAVALTVAMLADRSDVDGPEGPGILIALWVVLLTQIAVLRPRLDHRTRRILAGEPVPPSRLHLCYITLEVCKAALLAVLGTLLVVRITT